MPDVDISLPFEAYRGAEPYVFASYAHKDGARVFPELRALHEEGVRLWYDEGIDPGNEWPDEIAAALENATGFLVFISPAAVGSRNVRNEINMALSLAKPFLAVHLEDTPLPGGLRLQISSIQAIMKWRATPDGYRRRLIASLPAAVLAREAAVAVVATEPPPDRPTGISAERAPAPTVVQLDLQTDMAFVSIEPGSFDMGAVDGEDDEQPVHTVTLTRRIELARLPVTIAQWVAVMGGTPPASRDHDGLSPAEGVSWDDAQRFIEKLNARGGAATFRLPTEAEWEYACRAGSKGDYGGTGHLDDMGWHAANSGDRTHSAGLKNPNAWGLHDMHGSVWEWVSDRYGPYSSRAVADPPGPATGDFRVMRGGSWINSAWACR